ncbi:hypothetical protein [Clostridium perfringens]|uniref:hypothetical protein n=1 Tax=Clostridium perfringens TaxID=1502 RepID=UPI002342236D|nr:hypothetical protein [Clostridium perfringens]MDC4245564.1 hypothetical protein [Clostridium perfringens]
MENKELLLYNKLNNKTLEVKEMYFNTPESGLFAIELDKILSGMLVDMLKKVNKKGWRKERLKGEENGEIKDNDYTNFTNDFIKEMKKKDKIKTLNNFSFRQMMGLLADVTFDEKIRNKYLKKMI